MVLEAGQDDRWLVSDLDPTAAVGVNAALNRALEQSQGLQFIAVQTNPEAQSLRVLDDAGRSHALKS